MTLCVNYHADTHAVAITSAEMNADKVQVRLDTLAQCRPRMTSS